MLLIGGLGGIGSAVADVLQDQGLDELILTASTPRAGRSVETLDITDLVSVQALAARLAGRPLHAVVNCAGVNSNRGLDTEGWHHRARQEMDANYFGMLNLASVFAPVLAERPGGCFMTLLSFLSWVNLPPMATYCASKAAAHSALQAIRAQWAPRGLRVCGVYPTAVDTTMSRALEGPKMSPQTLAQDVVDALKSEVESVFPGDAADAIRHYLADPIGMQRTMAGT